MKLDADIIVEIKHSHKKSLPFGRALTKSTIFMVLCYVSWRDEIIPLMQCISHTTRACVLNHEILIKSLVESVPSLLRRLPQLTKKDILSLQYLNYLDLQLELKE